MAGGGWIRMRVDLIRDLKVIAIAEALGRDPRFHAWALGGTPRGRKATLSPAATRGIAVSALLNVWGNARVQGRAIGDDLALPFLTVDSLDSLADLPGFGAAMKAVGWAKESPEGGIVFPNFFAQNASTEELKKKQARERKQRQREKDREGVANVTRDEQRDEQRDMRDTGVTVPPGVTHVTPLEVEVEVLCPSSKDIPPAAPSVTTAEVDRAAVPSKPAPKKRRRKPPDAPRTPREPNPLFDTIAEVTGSDPALNGSLLGAVTAALAKAGYTPDDVREFARRYLSICTWSARDGRDRPTIPEVRKYISQIRAGPATVSLAPASHPRIKRASDNPAFDWLHDGSEENP